jgi:hypothetical protein
MGIDTQGLINNWLAKAIPTDCLINPKDYNNYSENDIVILDMSSYTRMKNNNDTYLWSTADWVKRLYSIIYQHFSYDKNNYHRAIILLLDNSQHTPTEKKRTRDARKLATEKQNIFPYSENKYKLDWNGIIDVSSDTPELFDSRRLAITSYLLIQLYEYFQEFLIQMYQNNDRDIIFPITIFLCWNDFGPTIFPGRDTKLYMPDIFDDNETDHQIIRNFLPWSNKIGEVDLQIPFIMRKCIRYSTENIPLSFLVYSIDSDTLPIGLRFLDIYVTPVKNEGREVKPLNFIWIWKYQEEQKKNKRAMTGEFVLQEQQEEKEQEKTKILAINMVSLYEAIRSANISIFQRIPDKFAEERVTVFIIGCILCGTDYYDKKEISHQFGAEKIITALIDSWTVKDGLRLAFKNNTPVIVGNETEMYLRYHGMFRFVQVLYSNLLNPISSSMEVHSYLSIEKEFGIKIVLDNNEEEGKNKKNKFLTHLYSKINKTISARFQIPTLSAIESSMTDLLFNYNYWSSNKKAIKE